MSKVNKIASLLPILLLLSLWNLAAEKSLNLGFSLVNQYPFGTYAEYFTTTVGAGLAAEIDDPKTLFPGLSARTYVSLSIPKGDTVESAWNSAVLLGVFKSFQITKEFSVTGEFDAGVWTHWLKPSSETVMTNALLVYFSPVLQTSVSLRYSWGLWQGELAPLYTLIPETNTILHAAGFRAGVYRSF